MFDLRTAGVTVRPIAQLDGEPGFAELFLEDVFVPDDPADPAASGVIGEVDNGWRVAMSTAANERGLSLRSPGRFLATTDRLVELWKACGDSVPPTAATDKGVADAWIGSRAYELSTYQTVSRLAAGGQLGLESSINKVFWSQWDIAAHETALDLQRRRRTRRRVARRLPVLPVGTDLCRHQRDSTQCDRRATPRPTAGDR